MALLALSLALSTDLVARSRAYTVGMERVRTRAGLAEQRRYILCVGCCCRCGALTTNPRDPHTHHTATQPYVCTYIVAALGHAGNLGVELVEEAAAADREEGRRAAGLIGGHQGHEAREGGQREEDTHCLRCGRESCEKGKDCQGVGVAEGEYGWGRGGDCGLVLGGKA